jgi:hypothetical protein
MGKRKCIVLGCEQKENLHRFPKDRERQIKWVAAINDESLLVLSAAQINEKSICSQHFEAKYLLGKRICLTGVPTINLPDLVSVESTVQGDSSFTARTINPIKKLVKIAFPSYKASNVCNQFSCITSFRAIKLKSRF